MRSGEESCPAASAAMPAATSARRAAVRSAFSITRIRHFPEGSSRLLRREYVPHHPCIPRCRPLYRLRRMLQSMSAAHSAASAEPEVHQGYRRPVRRISGRCRGRQPRAADQLTRKTASRACVYKGRAASNEKSISRKSGRFVCCRRSSTVTLPAG